MKHFMVMLISSFTFFVGINQLLYAEEAVKIGAGSTAGEYYNTIVPAISAALKKQGYSAVPEISAGSQDNIDKVMTDTLPAALTQLDIAALNLTAGKDPEEKLVLIGKIAPEALFCAAKKGGHIMSYADLTDEQENPLKVSVGPEKGGTTGTFKYLMQIDPDLKPEHITLVHKENTKMELNRLLSGRRDLVCFVMTPNPENELIQKVVASEELLFIEIDKSVFAQVEINNNRVYDIMEVPVGKGILGFKTEKVKTLVTWVGLVVNTKVANDKLLNALDSVVTQEDLLPADTLAAKSKALLKEFTQLIK
jgi:TRAP-type uncharacterized transport system substrate-binding protein